MMGQGCPLSTGTDLRYFRHGPIQTGLQSHMRWLEAYNFEYRKLSDCSIYVATTKALFSCAPLFSHLQKSGFSSDDLVIFQSLSNYFCIDITKGYSAHELKFFP